MGLTSRFRRMWRVFRKYFKLNITKIQVPWLGEIEFAPNSVEKKAAYDIYIELTTRVTTQRLADDHGSLKSALRSLHETFAFVRKTLHEAGLDSAYELGPVALAILNKGLRPFTAKWHPLFEAYEAKRPEGVTPIDHEMAWELAPEMRRELYELQNNLRKYAIALAKVAGIDEVLHQRYMDEGTH